jgi:hypothetical protein
VSCLWGDVGDNAFVPRCSNSEPDCAVVRVEGVTRCRTGAGEDVLEEANDGV